MTHAPVAHYGKPDALATADAQGVALGELAMVESPAAFEWWWRAYGTAHNYLAVMDPKAWERIAQAIEGAHARRRAREGAGGHA